MWKNTTNQWGTLSIALHWLMGLLIIVMLGMGLYMKELPPSDTKWMIYGLHKSFGVILLGLFFIRLIWRISQPIPKLPPMPTFHTFLAKSSPWVLYLLMAIMPISGYIMSTAAGYPVSLFNLWAVPSLIDPNPLLAGWAKQTHAIAGNVFIAVLGLHLAAALYHHWVKKDFLLSRMLGKSE